MKRKITIEKNIDELQFCFYDEKEDKFYKITSVENNGKITLEQLINSIDFLIEEIKRTVGDDLNDIWKRLDELEKRVDGQSN